jgi:hypothetical protein
VFAPRCGELDRFALLGRECCLENDSEVVRRGVWRAWIEMLEDPDGFHATAQSRPWIVLAMGRGLLRLFTSRWYSPQGRDSVPDTP